MENRSVGGKLELSIQDTKEYKFRYPFKHGIAGVLRSNIQMRDAIPARIKLELTLSFLATTNL